MVRLSLPLVVLSLLNSMGWVCKTFVLSRPSYMTGGALTWPLVFTWSCFEVIGGQVWLNHHGVHLFVLSNPKKTAITEQANWSYDNVIDAKGDAEGDGG